TTLRARSANCSWTYIKTSCARTWDTKSLTAKCSSYRDAPRCTESSMLQSTGAGLISGERARQRIGRDRAFSDSTVRHRLIDLERCTYQRSFIQSIRKNGWIRSIETAVAVNSLPLGNSVSKAVHDPPRVLTQNSH